MLTQVRRRLTPRIMFQLAILAVAALYTSMSFDLAVWSAGRPGPGLLPRIIGFMLLAATAVSLLKDIREAAPEQHSEYLKTQAVVGVMCVLLVPLMRYLGGTLGLTVFTYGALHVLSPRRYITNVAISVLLPLILYISFSHYFEAPWPKSEWSIPGYL